MNPTKLMSAVAALAMCFTLTACGGVRYTSAGSVQSAKMHGPPPHAPAHGYRHKHGKTVLVYDSTLEVYLVSGRSNYYFWEGHYYRSSSGGWQISVDIDGKWKPVSSKKLPKGLRNSVQVKNNKKRK
jgi:hypothetical protein